MHRSGWPLGVNCTCSSLHSDCLLRLSDLHASSRFNGRAVRRLKFQRNDSIPLTLQMVSSYDVNNLRCLPVVTANLTLAPSLEEVLVLHMMQMAWDAMHRPV